MVSETTYNISGAQIGNELLASTRSLTSSGWRDSSQEMPPKISVGDVPTPNILQKRCYQISNIQHEHLRKLTSYPCSLKFEEPFFATMIEQINILCKNKFQPSCKYKYFNMLFSDFHPNHSWNLGQVASTFNFDKFCKGFTQRAIDSCGTLCLGCHLTNARFQQIFVEKREFPKCYMSLCFLPLFGMLKYRNSTFWYNYWYYMVLSSKQHSYNRYPSIKRNQTKIRTNYSICCVFSFFDSLSIPILCQRCFHVFPCVFPKQQYITCFPIIFPFGQGWRAIWGSLRLLVDRTLDWLKAVGWGDGREGRNNNMGEKKWWL